MQDSLYRFSLDIHSTQSQVSIPVPQFDTARGICATLTEAGEPYQLSDDCRAVFSATKADGTVILNDCIIVNSSIIRYDFTEQTTAVVGIADCSITIYGKNNKILTSPRLTIVVYEVTRPHELESKDEMNAIDNIFLVELGRVEAERSRVEAEQQRIAAEEERTEAFENFKATIIQASPVRIGEVTLRASAWVGAASPYSQVVAVEGATKNSQVDLTPSVEQLAIFYHKDLAFVTENDDGVVTVYAIGQKPENDYKIQVTITEVNI